MRIAAASVLILVLVVADAAQAAKRPRLKTFDDCRALVDYARAGALRTDGGVGVDGRAAPPMVDAVVTPQIVPPIAPERTSADAGAPAAAPVGAAPEFSGTNVQEIGVDEPDILKTDGRRIFAVTDRTLRVVEAASGQVIGTLALDGFGHRLLLRGDRLLVVAQKGETAEVPDVSRPVGPTIAPVSSMTIVTELDVSAATPKVMRTMEVEGRFVDARQNGGTARLVIDSEPEPFIAPAGGSVDAAVKRAGTSRFLGQTVLRSRLSGKTFRRKLAPCKAISRPAQFSGLGVLAILTIDLDRGMYSLDRDGVMAGAQVVYGSDKGLYVASRRYARALELGADIPEGVRTEIHRFDISNPERTVYRASGSVPGFILNNYALSEFDGRLRVASTEEPQWFPGGGGVDSQSTVTVLQQNGKQLARVGSVSGLGKGERIYAVRFMGDKGYVVTFRQIDPLYTLDLSKPTAPRVVGELKIPGYSAYLHPVGEDRLLGIGRDGTTVQASLFDVSNMAAPQRLARLDFGPGGTPVETEPHAFLYWAKANLAVMPLQTYTSKPFTGAAGIRIGANTLADAGRIAHRNDARGGEEPIERTFVIGDQLYTLSWLGLATNRLSDLGPTRFTAF
ncbi:MAG TPA: beta-propeller domain-containing protein [Solirubrobacter sp.]|nr:beta-propeller domain-containing protein [Solirubrobacter sp.]